MNVLTKQVQQVWKKEARCKCCRGTWDIPLTGQIPAKKKHGISAQNTQRLSGKFLHI